MDVLTPGESSLSRRSLRTGAVAVGLSALLVGPGLLLPWYARAGATAVLLVGLARSTRALGSVVVAARRREPPAPPDAWPTVSVVVTAYNEADVLPATVDACLSLSYPAERLDVVVGYEAASSDGTGTVARHLAERHERVRAVERSAPPAGKAAATNHALAHASGDIVALLDADQRLERGALTRAVRWFADDSVWCVKGRCFGVNPRDSLLALCATVERGLVERTEFYARDLLGGFTLFTGGQAFFRASALDRLGGFDESLLVEDVAMAGRIQAAGGTIRVDPGVVTRERNPAGLCAWWHQRVRWARGGMQVARRYLDPSRAVAPRARLARVDAAATFGTVVALPVVALATPLVPLAWYHSLGRFPLTATALPLWLWVALVPLSLPVFLFLLDRREGRRHDPRERVAVVLLWPYVALQAAAMATAFVAEFVCRDPSVYVTSTDPGD